MATALYLDHQIAGARTTALYAAALAITAAFAFGAMAWIERSTERQWRETVRRWKQEDQRR